MTDLQKRNELFSEYLETLNPEQRAAVDRVEGPVLVIAGPGTGKTQLLAVRIGNILLNTDTKAPNILCLSFTDAGVHAMRQRLLGMIGPEAHRIPVHTFHGFCNRVIQDNMEYFGQGSLEPLTDLERIEIVRGLLSDLPVSHPLRSGRKDVYVYESQVRDLFTNMKKEGWTPGFVLKKTDEFLRSLPTHPAYIYQVNSRYGKKGDPKLSQIAAVTEKMVRLKAAADLFPVYQKALDKAGRYEYEDMLLWVNKAFENHEALLRNYQERYQYILVDEFQDTNGAQFRLLNQLLNYWDTPNVFIVGDDDQSIYEFQGARLENLEQFALDYQQGLGVVVLKENYRSSQEILDAAGRVIQNNKLRAVERLGITGGKQLVAHAGTGATPVISLYESRTHELAGLSVQIRKLIEQGTEPSQIAVLYSRHKQADPVQSLFRKEGIPFQTKRPQNILEAPLIDHFRELLLYIRDENRTPFSGEHRIFRLLHADFFGVDPLDIALVAAEARKSQEKQSHSGLYGDDESVPVANTFVWRQKLTDLHWLQSLRISDPVKLYNFGLLFNQWIAAASNVPLLQLMEMVISQSGMLDWILRHPDRIWQIQALSAFQNAIPLPVADRKPNLSFFLETLDNLEANRLGIPFREIIDTTPGVQLLTAHAAKGLEFDYVFMPDCVEDAWESSSGDARGRFQLPPTLTLSGEEDALEARRRLFYVAMTRARKDLFLSYARTANDGKALTQSRFLDETLLPHKPVTPDRDQVIRTVQFMLAAPASPVVSLPEKPVIESLISQLSLTITTLNRYLRCPIAFWYEDLLKVPGAMSEAAAAGIAVHSTMQKFFLRMKTDKQNQWPSAEILYRIYSREMEKMRINFSPDGYEQRKALGLEHLRRLYAEQIPFWKKRAVVERRISNTELEGVPVSGVLDKIEWLDGGKIRIVDFKTGTPDTSKTAPPDEKNPLGGPYWRQLAFYQLLLESANAYPEKVEKTAVIWLEPDKRGTFPVSELSFSPQDLNFVRDLVRQTYDNILAGKFDTGCGKPDCTWCKMHFQRSWTGEGRDAESDLDE
jgi:DNA helicase-2/ATP-dependent DNA helicase PcrA